jgi:hypothetical protein
LHGYSGCLPAPATFAVRLYRVAEAGIIDD